MKYLSLWFVALILCLTSCEKEPNSIVGRTGGESSHSVVIDGVNWEFDEVTASFENNLILDPEDVRHKYLFITAIADFGTSKQHQLRVSMSLPLDGQIIPGSYQFSYPNDGRLYYFMPFVRLDGVLCDEWTQDLIPGNYYNSLTGVHEYSVLQIDTYQEGLISGRASGRLGRDAVYGCIQAGEEYRFDFKNVPVEIF